MIGEERQYGFDAYIMIYEFGELLLLNGLRNEFVFIGKFYHSSIQDKLNMEFWNNWWRWSKTPRKNESEWVIMIHNDSWWVER